MLRFDRVLSRPRSRASNLIRTLFSHFGDESVTRIIDGLKASIASRKFHALLAGLIAVVASKTWGIELDTEQVAAITVMVTSLILGIAHEDAVKAKAAGSQVLPPKE